MASSSQDVATDGERERHVFCASYRQFVNRVVKNHLRDAVERLAELAEDEARVLLDDLHVHKVATAAPEHQQTTITFRSKAWQPIG